MAKKKAVKKVAKKVAKKTTSKKQAAKSVNNAKTESFVKVSFAGNKVCTDIHGVSVEDLQKSIEKFISEMAK